MAIAASVVCTPERPFLSFLTPWKQFSLLPSQWQNELHEVPNQPPGILNCPDQWTLIWYSSRWKREWAQQLRYHWTWRDNTPVVVRHSRTLDTLTGSAFSGWLPSNPTHSGSKQKASLAQAALSLSIWSRRRLLNSCSRWTANEACANTRPRDPGSEREREGWKQSQKQRAWNGSQTQRERPRTQLNW